MAAAVPEIKTTEKEIAAAQAPFVGEALVATKRQVGVHHFIHAPYGNNLRIGAGTTAAGAGTIRGSASCDWGTRGGREGGRTSGTGGKSGTGGTSGTRGL